MVLMSWSLPVAPTRDDEAAEDYENFPSSRSDTTAGDREIELKGDQFEDMTDSKLKLGTVELWALGISTALGGQCYLWNAGLSMGFGNMIVGFFLIASAYGCLTMCMAELSGALPFAGGAYGIARVTLGSLPGYLVACFDCYMSMFYTMLSTLLVGVIINFVLGYHKDWVPIWWLVIYLSYLITHTIGGLFFWRTLKVLSVGSLLLLVMFILGSIKFANFEENAPLRVPAGHPEIEAWFTGTPLMFFQVLPAYCWMFAGTKSMNLASHDAVEPKKDVPRAYMWTYATVVCIAIATVFVACSVPPGINTVKKWPFPHTFGFMLMFDINYKRAFCLILPPMYTSGFGFMYHYSSQVRAMGKSGLVNPWLGYDIPYFKTPVPAMLFGVVVGFLAGLRYLYLPTVEAEDVFSISLLGASLTYLSQFFSFIAFRLYYPTIKREFVSPLGIAGAVYGMLVFGLVLISLLGLKETPGIITFGFYVVLLLIYYVLVVRHRQTFSEEEKTVLFKAYLMKSNRLKAGRIRVGRARNRQGAGGSSTDSTSDPRVSTSPVHTDKKRLTDLGRQRSQEDSPTSTMRLFAGAAAAGVRGAFAGVMGVSHTGSHSSRGSDRTVTVQCGTASTNSGTTNANTSSPKSAHRSGGSDRRYTPLLTGTGTEEGGAFVDLDPQMTAEAAVGTILHTRINEEDDDSPGNPDAGIEMV